MDRKKMDNKQTPGDFILFAWWRIAVAVIITVAVIWAIIVLTDMWGSSPVKPDTAGKAPAAGEAGEIDEKSPDTVVASEEDKEGAIADRETTPSEETVSEPKAVDKSRLIKGKLFVEALMEPLTYELEERFWGWRPNDLIRITDNVNNMQLGVLEVTRRASVNLAERISRTGSASEINKNLESAMNLFMVKSDSYLFPSAESAYKDGLKYLEQYRKQLVEGRAKFYTRTDNLIPLLRSFANLLGSCDENLVKLTERDGSPVSTFDADDYFYYAKGVASAMIPVLEAVAVEFHEVLATRGGDYTLKHAIHSCEHAAVLKPLIVLEGGLDGIFANHRANMASQISHGRYYLEVLATTLST